MTGEPAELPEDAPLRGSRDFRDGLRQELPAWRAEGLVDEGTEKALVARYGLDRREGSLATAAVYMIGALLVGGGILSFIAWNWEGMPDPLKLVLIGVVLLATNVGGWWLWKGGGSWPRLGHALQFLGTLVYGASIGLVAQIYHVSENWYGGFGAWAFGAAVAAWVLRSTPNGALVAIAGTTWACGYVHERAGTFPLAPLFLAAVVLPLAWLERSRWLFALTVLCTAFAAAVGAGEESGRGSAVFAALLAVSAPLLAWPLLPRDEAGQRNLGGVSRALGFLGVGVLAYIASFKDMGRELAFERLDGKTNHWQAGAIPLLVLAVICVAAGLARSPDPRAAVRRSAASLGGLAGIALLYVGMTGEEESLWLALAGNLALGLPAGLAVASSVRDLERGPFWVGTLALAVLVVTRFLEFDTNLGVKAAAFAGSGVAVILVGMAFERRMRARGAGHGG